MFIVDLEVDGVKTFRLLRSITGKLTEIAYRAQGRSPE